MQPSICTKRCANLVDRADATLQCYGVHSCVRQQARDGAATITGDFRGDRIAAKTRGGALADPCLRSGERRIVRPAMDDQLGKPMGAEAGMKIKQQNATGLLRLAREDVSQRSTRPDGFAPAIEDAMRIMPLTTGNRLL
jgi:hypothetical protein